ncbi:MAG: rod-binding protein [Litorimonas sp.]
MTPFDITSTSRPLPDLSARLASGPTASPGTDAADGTDKAKQSALRAVAQDFEAAFIAQMLTHSGLDEALTSGSGSGSTDIAAAFGTFYVERIADEIAQSGGLGMAEVIYRQLERYDADGAAGAPLRPQGDPS